MTTNQIMNLDCRKEENKQQIQKVLRTIKPLSKCSVEQDVPIEMLEKLIFKISKKYKMRVSSIMPDVWSNDKTTVWKASVLCEQSLTNIGVIYGLSLYELLTKVSILMYGRAMSGTIKTK